MSAKRLAEFGILTAVALVLSWIESMIPVSAAVPGIKLGLANTVLLYAVMLRKPSYAFILMLVKVLISGLLFSGAMAVIYSLAGGVLSLCAMLPLSKHGKVTEVGISCAGAVMHNIGQCAVGMVLVGIRPMMAYMPVLIVAGVICGVVTGFAAKLVLKALPKRVRDND